MNKEELQKWWDEMKGAFYIVGILLLAVLAYWFLFQRDVEVEPEPVVVVAESSFLDKVLDYSYFWKKKPEPEPVVVEADPTLMERILEYSYIYNKWFKPKPALKPEPKGTKDKVLDYLKQFNPMSVDEKPFTEDDKIKPWPEKKTKKKKAAKRKKSQGRYKKQTRKKRTGTGGSKANGRPTRKRNQGGTTTGKNSRVCPAGINTITCEIFPNYMMTPAEKQKSYEEFMRRFHGDAWIADKRHWR